MKDAEEIGNRLDPSQDTKQGLFSLVPIGRDYSSRVSVMFMGDMSLPSTMSQDVLGVMSLIDDQGRPLGFDFGMRSEQSARDFLGLLQHWADQRGGTNAVFLEFLMLDDGEVVLLCGEDTDSIVKMFCPERYQLDLMPLVYGALSHKSFPKPTPMLLRLLSGGTLHEVDIGARVVVPDDKILPAARVPGLTLHKQEIPVRRENEITPQSQAGAFLWARSHGYGEALPTDKASACPFTRPEDTLHERRRRVHRLFPISLVLLSASGWATSVTSSLCTQGFRPWQVWQALCNLTTLDRWARATNWKDHDTKPSDVQLIKFLIDYPETVGDTSSFDNAINEDCVRNQLVADSQELWRRYAGQHRDIPSPSDIQAALGQLNLLGEVDAAF